MRIIIAQLIWVLLPVYSNGQVSQKSILIGGSASISSDKTEYNNSSSQETSRLSGTISPTFGYFVINRLSVGVSLPLSYSQTKFKYDNPSYEDMKLSTFSYGAGPFVRYYIPLSKLYIVNEVGYSILHSTYDSPYFDSTTGTTGIRDITVTRNKFTLASGLCIFLNNSVGLELLLNYNRYDNSSDDEPYINSKQNSFILSAGFQIYLSK